MIGISKFKTNTVGGCPTASFFLLLRQKKGAKEKATPVRRCFAVPCVARLVRRLRNSRFALKQSSPKSPDQSALLGGTQGMEKQNEKPQTREEGSALLATKNLVRTAHTKPPHRL